MSPFTEGDIPMEGDDERDELPQLPNGVINVETQDSDDGDDDFSGQSEDEYEEDAGGYSGYQLLSQDAEPENPPEDTEPSSEHSSTGAQVELPSHLANLMPTQSVRPDPATCVSYGDTQDQLESRKQCMATDDQIRLAMKGITLPPSSIPSWAATLDEDEWKRMLQRRVHGNLRKDEEQREKEEDSPNK